MLRVILAAWILAAAAGVSQIGAQIVAQTVEGHVVNSATGADSQGRFQIEAVKLGAYTAHYWAHDFWPVPNNQAGRVTVRANESTYAEIRLITR
jgi:hypothetical protein